MGVSDGRHRYPNLGLSTAILVAATFEKSSRLWREMLAKFLHATTRHDAVHIGTVLLARTFYEILRKLVAT